MYSYPNMIPLPPDAIHGIWKAVKPFQFSATYGSFIGQNVRGKDLKKRLLESMKIVIKTAGWVDHSIYNESL